MELLLIADSGDDAKGAYWARTLLIGTDAGRARTRELSHIKIVRTKTMLRHIAISHLFCIGVAGTEFPEEKERSILSIASAIDGVKTSDPKSSLGGEALAGTSLTVLSLS